MKIRAAENLPLLNQGTDECAVLSFQNNVLIKTIESMREIIAQKTKQISIAFGLFSLGLIVIVVQLMLILC